MFYMLQVLISADNTSFTIFITIIYGLASSEKLWSNTSSCKATKELSQWYHFKDSYCLYQRTYAGCLPQKSFFQWIEDIMKNLRLNVIRNILPIQKVKSLNGLFGLRCYSFNADIPQDEIVQLWNARTVNNCNLTNWFFCPDFYKFQE